MRDERGVQQTCEHPDCHRMSRAFSRFCAEHESIARRYGDARATVLKARDVLKHYSEAAEAAWTEVQGKQATRAALECARRFLQWRRPSDYVVKHERLASELIARLECDEAALLKRSLAVEMAIFYRRPFWARKEVEDTNRGRLYVVGFLTGYRLSTIAHRTWRVIGQLIDEYGVTNYGRGYVEWREKQIDEARALRRAAGDFSADELPKGEPGVDQKGQPAGRPVFHPVTGKVIGREPE